MGKQGKAPWKRNQDGGQDGGSHRGSQWWSYWKGSWPSSPGQGKNQNYMPKYDQVTVQEEDGSALTGTLTSNIRQLGQGTDLMKAIQKALSATRKADQRARRLSQEKKQKEAQWRQYGREMKETYERELRKFNQDVLRIDAELEDALQTGHQAAETVKHLATHGLSAQQVDVSMEDSAVSSGWETLLAGSGDSPEMCDQFLRDALQAAASAVPALTASDPWIDPAALRRDTSEVRSLAHAPSAACPPARRGLLGAGAVLTSGADASALPATASAQPPPPLHALAPRVETGSPGQAPLFGPPSSQADSLSLPLADPYQASPSTAVFSGMPVPGARRALAPFCQAGSLPSAGQDLGSVQGAGSRPAPASHVVGRPPVTELTKESCGPTTPKPHGAPRTPIKQLPKSMPAKVSVEAGAQARQQLLEAKRAAPPMPEGVPLPSSPGPPLPNPAPCTPQSFLIHDDEEAEVPPSPEFGKME